MANQQDILNGFHKQQFQHDLIGWFEIEQRDLPWRKNKDPYKVWVSEIMLQQTKVDTVIPYFNSFIEQFPNIEALANAEEEKVLKAWEGLGYYSRARNLQAAVKEVRETYNGIVPKEVKEISSLKGVGPYTTGAILSIAYGIPQPAVDGNVMRVLSRILLIKEDIAKPKTRKIFEEAIQVIISKENPSYFNQGLMELGALICTPTSPSCLLCPVQSHCRAFHEGIQRDLPIKTKKKSTKEVHLIAGVFVDDNGNYLIRKRDSVGLLANLWEYPTFEKVSDLTTPKKQLEIAMKETYKVDVEVEDYLCSIQHVFSHLVWNITVYKGRYTHNEKTLSGITEISEQQQLELPFPVSHQKIWKAYKENLQS